MGEIADMMLDGTMCQGCGVFLHDGDDGLGFPGYCEGCQPTETRERKRHRTPADRTAQHKPYMCACGKRFRLESAKVQHMKDKEHGIVKP